MRRLPIFLLSAFLSGCVSLKRYNHDVELAYEYGRLNYALQDLQKTADALQKKLAQKNIKPLGAK